MRYMCLVPYVHTYTYGGRIESIGMFSDERSKSPLPSPSSPTQQPTHLHMYVPTYPTYIRMVWYGMYLLETDSTAAKPAYIKRHAMLQMEYVVDVVGTSRPAIRLPLDATRLDAT